MLGDKSYTSKDINAIREDMIEYVKAHDPNWTDYSESSLQTQYLDIVSGVVDMLLFYLDNQALETYLTTARQRKNVKNILEMLNYTVNPKGTAKGYVTASRKITLHTGRGTEVSYLTGRVFIPKYTQVYKSGDPNSPLYLTTEDVLMTEEKNTIDIPVIQGEIKDIKIDMETIRAFYRVYISDTTVPLEYVEILDPGWEKVPDAFTELQGGQKYSVHCDSDGKVFILFTCDWRKYLPTEVGAAMSIRLILSEGVNGTVAAGTLNEFGEGPIDYDLKTSLRYSLTVYNSKPTYGAFDEPSINEQKANAKLWMQTYDRLITLQDFEVLLKKYSWIRDCYVADWRTNIRLCPYPHLAKGWIVTTDGDNVDSAEMLSEIQKELQDKATMMTEIHLYPAEFVVHNKWRIGISLNGGDEYAKEYIRSSVEQKLCSRYLLSEFCKGNSESVLSFNIEVRKATIINEIKNMSDAIISVDVPLDEVIQVKENEFLDVKSIEVYIMD